MMMMMMMRIRKTHRRHIPSTPSSCRSMIFNSGRKRTWTSRATLLSTSSATSSSHAAQQQQQQHSSPPLISSTPPAWTPLTRQESSSSLPVSYTTNSTLTTTKTKTKTKTSAFSSRTFSSLAGTSFTSTSNNSMTPEAAMRPLLQQAGVEWDVLMEYAQQQATPVRLADMVRRYTSHAALRLQNAQFLHREIPVRVAHRIVDLMTLPHGLSTVAPIQQVALTYLSYLPQFQAVPMPTTVAQEEVFTDFLQTLVLDRHSVPAAIAAGVQEWQWQHQPQQQFLSSSSSSGGGGRSASTTTTSPQDEMEKALYRFFTARVGLRLLTEHHVLTSNRPSAQELLKVTSIFPPDFQQQQQHLTTASSSSSSSSSAADQQVVGCIHRNVNVVHEATRVVDLVKKQSALYCLERQRLRTPASSMTTTDFSVATAAGPDFEIIDCKAQHHPQQQQRNASIDSTSTHEFTFVPHHLHYILAELFKNASRATIHRYGEIDPTETSASSDPSAESIPQSPLQRAALKANGHLGLSSSPQQQGLNSPRTIPPIQVIVAQGAEDVTIKIADKAGGIPRSKMAFIWKFAHSTAPADEIHSDFGRDEGTGARIRGFGLPLARIYARYFGGELTLKSTEGHGVDAYLYLPRLVRPVKICPCRCKPVREKATRCRYRPRRRT